jgi:Reverse transcriptase (RNA-dependent DNA polymerase)
VHGMTTLMHTSPKKDSRGVQVSQHYMSSMIKNGMFVVSLYVDDLFIFIKNYDKMIHEFKNDMMKRYKMNNLGLLHYFLGIEIDQKKDDVFISQKKMSKIFT